MSVNIEEQTTSTNRLYEGRIISLRVDSVLLPNGKSSTREIVEHRGAVAIVPMIDTQTVIMVRQFRAAAGGSLLEIPAGTLDREESMDVCAHRELAEEINYKAGTMTKLFQMYVAPGYSTEIIHLYVACNLTPTIGHTDEDEFLNVIHLPLVEAIGMIASGEIQDAKSICGLLQVERILSELTFEE